ncbi:Conserved oligomeric Golgi complex subunit 2, partial [Rhizophlyctis rosea]
MSTTNPPLQKPSINTRLASALFGPSVPVTPSTPYPLNRASSSFSSTSPEKQQYSFTPLSFTLPVFLEEEFTPSGFLSERRHIALDRLKWELGHALREVKNELVELINRDYQDFISLSAGLTGVEDSITNLQDPLTKLRTDVSTIQTYLSTTSTSLSTLLAHRSTIRSKKALLHLLVSINDSVSKIEELLGISGDKVERDSITSGVDGKDEGLEGGEKVDGKLIERVAIEYNQLLYFVERAKGLEFLGIVEWRITRIKETLKLSLSRALKQSFLETMRPNASDTSIATLSQYLRTYVLIDRVREAGTVFGDAVVQPFIDK